jgi:HEAT repeat protein
MDLPKVAFDIVAARMSADSGVTSYVLDAIQRNVPELRVAPRLRLLQAVLALAPAKLAQHVGNLTSLLDSPVPQIRERALAGVSLFTTPEEAEQQVRRALNDSSPSVRSAAALAMRKLVRRDTTSSLVT